MISTIDELDELKRQYQRLTIDEKRSWRALLQRAEQLDDELADLHLAFPAIEVRVYHWKTYIPASFSPGQLLQTMDDW